MYKPGLRQWFASFTVEVPDVQTKFGSQSELAYNSIVAFDLGCETAITTYDGKNVEQISNPRFTQKTEAKIKKASKELRRKQIPNRNKKVKASRRWKKANKRVQELQRKAGTQRRDWQHKITSEMASCYDIGVTEQRLYEGDDEKSEKRQQTKEAKSRTQ